MTAQLLDLSHRIGAGMSTHPDQPGLAWDPFRSREQSLQTSGTELQIHRVGMVGSIGTSLDGPLHRFVDGAALASLPLTAVADLPEWPVRAYALVPQTTRRTDT